MRLFLLAVCVWLVPGCFLSRDFVNEPLQLERIQKLVPGTTTAAQALEILGAPTEVVQLGRRSAWRYEHAQSKSAGLTVIVFTAVNTDSQTDRAWLFFDENDVLKHCGATLGAGSAEWTLPWQDSHE